MTEDSDKNNVTVFGQAYAGQYDLLYQDKDYGAECDLLEEIFRRFATRETRDLLDLGCGTGQHAIRLAQRGFQVTGLDASSEMLAGARQRVAELSKGEDVADRVNFQLGDARDFELGTKFDAALYMFAALGYITDTDDLLRSLAAVNRHLRPGGLLIFDTWYGPAVLSTGPSDRTKVIRTGKDVLIRTATGALDVQRNLCRVHYQTWQLTGDRLVDAVEETHVMRYFFPLEIKHLLQDAGFEMIRATRFGSLDEPPGREDWNVQFVARKVGSLGANVG